MKNIKASMLVLLGAFLLLLGLIFVVIPGPAVIFLPLGLALLATEYRWAHVCLRQVQRFMRSNAKRLDSWLLAWKHGEKKRSK